MRSTLLTIFSLFLLTCGFFLYQKIIAKPSAAGSDRNLVSIAAPKQDTGPKKGPMSRGKGPWYRSYENNKEKSRFRAAEYTPQANGKIAVTDPEAWFFMAN